MQIKKYIFFDKKSEKTKFLSLIRASRTEIEAIQKISNEFPDLSIIDLGEVINNFKQELTKDV